VAGNWNTKLDTIDETTSSLVANSRIHYLALVRLRWELLHHPEKFSEHTLDKISKSLEKQPWITIINILITFINGLDSHPLEADSLEEIKDIYGYGSYLER
jgi:hypothetical protein